MDTEEKPVLAEDKHPEVKTESWGAGGDTGDDEAKNGDTDTSMDAVKDEPSPTEEDTPSELTIKKEEIKEDEDGEEDESEEDEDEEPPVPLLERSPQTSGRRERKTVERYVQQTREESKRGAHVLEEGSGEKLGDCPVICHNIATGRPDDVRVLHQIIFARAGRPYEFRRNLRAFRGFAFKEGTPGFIKKKENLEKYRLDVLRSLSKILDMDKKSGSREELALNILQFLCDPKPSGREVKQKKKRKSKGAAGSAKKPKKAAKSADAAEDSGSEDEDEGEDGDEAGEEGKETPKKKKATPKKTPAKKTPKEKTPGKASAKKPAAKKTPKKRKKSEVDAGSSSEDDEPLVKKPKAKKAPTDNDIKALVRKLLDGANLEEVTMKNILTKVYAKYPTHDLTARKDFIKTTVKSLIS